jgi:hypothetical protein
MIFLNLQTLYFIPNQMIDHDEYFAKNLSYILDGLISIFLIWFIWNILVKLKKKNIINS